MIDKKIANEIFKNIKKISTSKKLILHSPFIKKDDLESVKKCLKSSYISTVSNYTNLFEKKLKNFTKSNYVISTINGTSALQVAINTCGIKKNEEVLIPNLNYIASSNATLYCNAIPHFVDVEKKTLGIDIDKLKIYLKKISVKKKGKLYNIKTKRIISAIIPTHIFGNPCQIDKLIKLSKFYNLKIIEDASEALGTFYKRKHLGTFGDIGVLSFNGNKIISTGGGGALLIKNKKNFKKALSLTKISRKNNNSWNYDYDDIGYNYRLPGLNASLGISQIKKINKILNLKKLINTKYKKVFSENKYFELLSEIEQTKSNHWLNTIFLFNSNLKLRDNVVNELNKRNIGARPVWKLMHKIKHLSKFPKDNLNNSIILEKGLINLPSSPDIYE